MSAAGAPAADDCPVPPAIAAHPAWFRLEDQRTYYAARAVDCQDTYKRIKAALIAISAAIPLLAFMPGDAGKWIVAAAGIAIAVLEAVLLLNQYGPLWVKYRGTAESLKRERWLLLARAGEYAGLDDDPALRLLAERVEALLDVEHREWVEEQKQALARLENARQWVEERRARRDGAAASGAQGAAAGAPGGAGADVNAGAGAGTGAGAGMDAGAGTGAGTGTGDDAGTSAEAGTGAQGSAATDAKAGAGTTMATAARTATAMGTGSADDTLPADAVPSVSAASADEPAVAEPPRALPAPGAVPSPASAAVLR